MSTDKNMRDVGLTWDTSIGAADISFESNDLVQDDGLYTAVIISLFCDARAKNDDVLPDPGSTDRRGWWGDHTSEKENDRIGSRLWLLGREKTEAETLARAKEYALEALQWMVDEEVAAKVEVNSYRGGSAGNDRLELEVKIYRVYGEVVTYKFESAWEGTFDGS